MNLRKREFLPLKIESGEIGWVLGLWWILLLGLLLCACMQIICMRASAQYVQDALAASNLAAAVIDIEEYGKSRTLVIPDEQAALGRYKQALSSNLRLKDTWVSERTGLLTGPVRLERFCVYNVQGDTVEIRMIGADGNVTVSYASCGAVVAPNGVTVENTGIYSEISYSVPSFFGLVLPAREGKLCDVICNNEEEESSTE